MVNHRHRCRYGERRQDVHRRAGNRHAESLPLRFGHEFIGRPCPLLIKVLARHLDVAAQGYEAESIIGIALFDPPKPLAKPNAKYVDSNAEELRDNEMTELVNYNHRTQHEHKYDYHL